MIIVMSKIKLQEILKLELKVRKITLNALAKECAIPPSVLHGWLHGTLPSAKNLRHIKTLSDYLQISIDKILFGDKSKDQQKQILFQSTFTDGKAQYKVTVEKIN
jgi:predicted transcriptional regulator